MKASSNILGKLRLTIVCVLVGSLSLGTIGFMTYFKGFFAKKPARWRRSGDQPARSKIEDARSGIRHA